MITGTIGPIHKKAIKSLSRGKKTVKSDKLLTIDSNVYVKPAYVLAMAKVVDNGK